MGNTFIASDRVIRHKLGAKAADILDVLIYKHKYWKNEGKLDSLNYKGSFYISLNDLKAETTFSPAVITKGIKHLREANLVHSIRQGLNKPNRYLIDEEIIDRYKEKHRADLEKWQENVRDSSVSSSSKRKCENSTSRVTKKSIHDVTKETSTKNKNTNNKNTKNKNTTNRASSEKLIDLEYDLEAKINNLRNGGDEDIISLFNFLCSLVDSFKAFKMSDDDKKLILKIVESEIPEYKLSDEIISNASDITEGRKEARFGSLFVGLTEVVTNYDKNLV